MSEIVNLRRRRKAKAREDAAKAAEQNRATFGLSKAERQKQQSEKTAAVRFLDGHRRERSASVTGDTGETSEKTGG
jgi:hypothetical protein